MNQNRRLDLNRRSLDYYYANLRDDPAYREKARLKARAWYLAHRDEKIATRRRARLLRETKFKTRVGTKRCSGCMRVKSTEQFTRDSSKHDGLRTTCKLCKKASDARWHSRNKMLHNESSRARYRRCPEYYRVAQKRWIAEHPERAATLSKLNVQRRRARLRNVPCDLTAAEWRDILKKANGRCRYCRKTCGKLTMDHKIPVSRGGHHTASNITAACGKCNSSKGAKTEKEFARTFRRL